MNLSPPKKGADTQFLQKMFHIKIFQKEQFTFTYIQKKLFFHYNLVLFNCTVYSNHSQFTAIFLRVFSNKRQDNNETIGKLIVATTVVITSRINLFIKKISVNLQQLVLFVRVTFLCAVFFFKNPQLQLFNY